MPGSMPDSGVSDYEYRQRVRRYKPSSLLPLIAVAAVRYREQQDWLNSPYRKYTPWALADAARVSLAYGTEHNRADAHPERFAICASTGLTGRGMSAICMRSAFNAAS